MSAVEPSRPSERLPSHPGSVAPGSHGHWLWTGQYRDCRVSDGEMRLKPVYRWIPNCWCAQCLPFVKRALWGVFEMILCPICGNKRCPRANDHRNSCTGSNEPGQVGSRY